MDGDEKGCSSGDDSPIGCRLPPPEHKSAAQAEEQTMLSTTGQRVTVRRVVRCTRLGCTSLYVHTLYLLTRLYRAVIKR